ncbi:gamma-glutamylcyclotransferase [Aestuariibius sp. 2305UL40-4]|uniref:gamma-glutamylcyclotransferase n=1 Tax=Aestuariibius violaceus TaxID=3234132 RepID=UPI00345EC3BE
MWVFGYGSLLWNPGFRPAEAVKARLDGYHRSFCMRSVEHRGTRDVPGLVLALDAAEGASCTGMALRAAEAEVEAVLAMLRERELVTAAYLERHLTLALDDGRQVDALAYVIDPDHGQYCRLPLQEQARIIATAHGGRGPNTEYLHNTAAHLAELGVRDAEIEWLDAEVRRIAH